jgi:hypothetical protein
MLSSYSWLEAIENKVFVGEAKVQILYNETYSL